MLLKHTVALGLSLGTSWALNFASNVTYSYGSGLSNAPGSISPALFTYADDTSLPGGLPLTINTLPITYKGGSVLSGDTVSVYVVFYGAKNDKFSYFSSQRRQIVLDFINQVSSTSWYAVAKRYGIANTLQVAKVVDLNCNFSPFAYGCNININQVEKIISSQLYDVAIAGSLDPYWKKSLDNAGYGLPYDPKGIYLLISGPETIEQFSSDATATKAGRDYCGYHSTFSTKDSQLVRYAFIQVPNLNETDVTSILSNEAPKPASKCFFDRNKVISPNAEPELDMAIGIVGHELIEVMLAPNGNTTYMDEQRNEVMDKCETWFSDLKKADGYDYNMEVGGKRYLVSPVWDLDNQFCTMNSTLASKAKLFEQHNNTWTQVAGGLIQSSVSGDKVCGVNSANDIYCATYGQANWSQKSGKLKWISIDGIRACGVNSNDDIYCADNIDNPAWVQISGKLKQIDLHGSYMCGVNSGDNIYCASYMQSNWKQLPGALMQLSIYGTRMCGCNSANNIWCTDDFNNVNWIQLPGALRQLDMQSDTLCGVNSNDDIYCSPYRTGVWTQLSGKLRNIAIDAGKAYGVNGAGNIFYKLDLK